MASNEAFKAASAVQESFKNSHPVTREQKVRRMMNDIQRENEENFLKQFRESDFRELVSLMGGEVSEEILEENEEDFLKHFRERVLRGMESHNEHANAA